MVFMTWTLKVGLRIIHNQNLLYFQISKSISHPKKLKKCLIKLDYLMGNLAHWRFSVNNTTMLEGWSTSFDFWTLNFGVSGHAYILTLQLEGNYCPPCLILFSSPLFSRTQEISCIEEWKVNTNLSNLYKLFFLFLLMFFYIAHFW